MNLALAAAVRSSSSATASFSDQQKRPKFGNWLKFL
jgi:hypothetical protein